MDSQTVVILVVAFLLMAIVLGILFTRRMKVKVAVPGVEMSAEGENGADAAVTAENIKSRTGGVIARDGTGRGVVARGIDARKDVEISSSAPESRRHPKG